MDERVTQAIAEIEAAGLGPACWRTARRLLDRADENGGVYLNYADLLALTECSAVQSALRHLTDLMKPDIIHYSTNEQIYIRFRAWARNPRISNCAPTRSFRISNCAPTRSFRISNCAPTRSFRISNCAPTRSFSEIHEETATEMATDGDDESLLLLLLKNNNNNAVVVEENNNNNAPVAAVDAGVAVDCAEAVEVADDVAIVGDVAEAVDVDESLQTLLAENGFVIAPATVAGWVRAHGAPHVEKAIRLAGERRARHPARYIEGIFSNWQAKGYPAVEVTRDFSRYAMEMATLPASSEAPAWEVAETEPEPELIDQSVWDKAKADLQLQLASSTYFTWLHDTWAAEHDDECLTVATASTYARDWLQHRLRSVVKRTVKNIVGHAVDVTFVVRPHRREFG